MTLPAPRLEPVVRRGPGIAARVVLALIAMALCGAGVEIGYRLFAPFPFFAADEVNMAQHGNLTQYDATLGWAGVPGRSTVLVTENNRVALQHNQRGDRDLEHDRDDPAKPALVLLGDSFTWGYEVEFADMFASRLRARLPGWTLVNLAHRGYGTDQSLLAFRRWRGERPDSVRAVLLMFSENDLEDNICLARYEKPKPMFRLMNGQLALVHVPVPRSAQWDQGPMMLPPPPRWKLILQKLMFRSHFLHDIWWHYESWREAPAPLEVISPERRAEALRVTSALLGALRDEVRQAGAECIVGFIPSKVEIHRLAEGPPYQAEVTDLCRELGIRTFDLAPYFLENRRATYYRMGMHWSARGHRVAAQGILDSLEKLGIVTNSASPP